MGCAWLLGVWLVMLYSLVHREYAKMTSVRYVDFDQPALTGVKGKLGPRLSFSQQTAMEVKQ